MKEILTAFAKFITHPSGYGVAFFVLIILIITAVNIILFRQRLWPITHEMRKVNLLMEGYETEEAFCENFEDIDNYLGESKLLGPFWQEFTATFIFPDPGIGDPISNVIQSTVDSEFYFNAENLLTERVNSRFYNQLPNYLIGLGILGTFIGLVAGISLSAPFLQSQDINETKQALRSLLDGASLAFWTSIAGILMSIAFSVGEKKYMHIYQGLVHKWNALLDERLDHVTLEYLASKQLEQAREQSLQLKKFNTDFAITLGEVIGDKLDPALKGVAEGLRGLRGEGIAEEFGEIVRTAVGGELEHFGDTIKVLTEQLNETVTELKDGYQEMVNNTERLHQGFQEVLGETRTAMNVATHGMNEFNSSVTSMREGAEYIELMKASLEGVVETFDSSTKNLEVMGDTFSSATQSMSSSIESLGELATNLKGMTAGFNSMDESTEEFFSKVDDGLKGFVASVQDFVGHLESGLSNVAKELTAVAVEFREAMEESADNAGDQT